MLCIIITLSLLPIVHSQTEFYLTLETEPEEVEIIDPEALTGEGYHSSGTIVIIDAKQTIISGNIRYEFAEWE